MEFYFSVGTAKDFFSATHELSMSCVTIHHIHQLPIGRGTLRGCHAVSLTARGGLRNRTCRMAPDLSTNTSVVRGVPRKPNRFDSDVVFDDTTYDSDLEMYFARINAFPASARSVALLQLLRVDEEGAFANHVSGDVLDQVPLEASVGFKRSIDALDARERRQVTEIVSGVIRWQRRLHWTLSNLPKPTNVDLMDSPLRILLYMGAYEVCGVFPDGNGLSFAAIIHHVSPSLTPSFWSSISHPMPSTNT